MKTWQDLSNEDKIKIEQELIKNNEYELLKYSKAGHLCVGCFMVYYNCLCYHEDL